MNINEHVCLASEYKPVSGRCRRATAIIDPLEFRRRFGDPHLASLDDKSTDIYAVETPRGQVTVYRYWWNAWGEWSIGADSNKAALWACKWLRTHGVHAKRGITREEKKMLLSG